jgi:hypothetical protein
MSEQHSPITRPPGIDKDPDTDAETDKDRDKDKDVCR